MLDNKGSFLILPPLDDNNKCLTASFEGIYAESLNILADLLSSEPFYGLKWYRYRPQRGIIEQFLNLTQSQIVN